jgi:hypothetical protein
MGGEKFHITVTIDNEKALQIADFRAFARQEFYCCGINRSHRFVLKKSTRSDPGTTFRLEIFLSCSAIKAAMVVGISSADICVGALAL